MVRTLDQVARGEARASLLAKSMRSMVADQMAADGATEEELAKVRMTPEAKAKIVNEFSARQRAKQGITEENVSVNSDTGVDTQALLTGDSNEEARMADRLHEQKKNAQEGKMPRVTVDDIRQSQRSPPPSNDNQLI